MCKPKRCGAVFNTHVLYCTVAANWTKQVPFHDSISIFLFLVSFVGYILGLVSFIGYILGTPETQSLSFYSTIIFLDSSAVFHDEHIRRKIQVSGKAFFIFNFCRVVFFRCKILDRRYILFDSKIYG